MENKDKPVAINSGLTPDAVVNKTNLLRPESKKDIPNSKDAIRPSGQIIYQ